MKFVEELTGEITPLLTTLPVRFWVVFRFVVPLFVISPLRASVPLRFRVPLLSTPLVIAP